MYKGEVGKSLWYVELKQAVQNGDKKARFPMIL